MERPTATPDRDESAWQPSGGPVGKGNHIVRQGEGIESIAFDHGFFWESLWNDPRNSRLKRERKDPNTLLPGDELYLREKQEKDVPCASEQRHRFRRKGVPERFIVYFKVDGKPRANEAYVLEIDGTLSEGKADENGKVEVWIPPNARKGRIFFAGGGEYELGLGDLDPITAISGIQGRLGNLGFYDGAIDGKMSGRLRQAIRRFQEECKLDSTGEMDDATQKRLQQAYGG